MTHPQDPNNALFAGFQAAKTAVADEPTPADTVQEAGADEQQGAEVPVASGAVIQFNSEGFQGAKLLMYPLRTRAPKQADIDAAKAAGKSEPSNWGVVQIPVVDYTAEDLANALMTGGAVAELIVDWVRAQQITEISRGWLAEQRDAGGILDMTKFNPLEYTLEAIASRPKETRTQYPPCSEQEEKDGLAAYSQYLAGTGVSLAARENHAKLLEADLKKLLASSAGDRFSYAKAIQARFTGFVENMQGNEAFKARVAARLAAITEKGEAVLEM